jgi:hypothetical protein
MWRQRLRAGTTTALVPSLERFISRAVGARGNRARSEDDVSRDLVGFSTVHNPYYCLEFLNN